MKLLAFAASNSRQSINRQLVTYASRLLEEGLIDDVEVNIIDLNDFEMPIYSADRENDNGIPQLAHDFFNKIGAADAVLVSFAEHNGSYSAAYKNLFDWASRIDARVYQEKPAVLLATSPGGRGGASILAIAAKAGQFFGYEVLASLAVPSFHKNFDMASGSITDSELDQKLRVALKSLAEHRRETPT